MSRHILNPKSDHMFDDLQRAYNAASATPQALQYPCISVVPFSGYVAATLPVVAGGA